MTAIYNPDAIFMESLKCDVCGRIYGHNPYQGDYGEDLSGDLRDICHECQDKHEIRVCEGCEAWRRIDLFHSDDDWLCCICTPDKDRK